MTEPGEMEQWGQRCDSGDTDGTVGAGMGMGTEMGMGTGMGMGIGTRVVPSLSCCNCPILTSLPLYGSKETLGEEVQDFKSFRGWEQEVESPGEGRAGDKAALTHAVRNGWIWGPGEKPP